MRNSQVTPIMKYPDDNPKIRWQNSWSDTKSNHGKDKLKIIEKKYLKILESWDYTIDDLSLKEEVLFNTLFDNYRTQEILSWKDIISDDTRKIFKKKVWKYLEKEVYYLIVVDVAAMRVVTDIINWVKTFMIRIGEDNQIYNLYFWEQKN